jgi:hypothetical protein
MTTLTLTQRVHVIESFSPDCRTVDVSESCRIGPALIHTMEPRGA